MGVQQPATVRKWDYEMTGGYEPSISVPISNFTCCAEELIGYVLEKEDIRTKDGWRESER
jgi:hypothetical protein